MKADEMRWLSAEEIARLIRDKEVSPVEVVNAVLDAIEHVNPVVNAYCTVVPEMARAAARAAEERVVRGNDLGILHGVPYSAKDLTVTKTVRTTMGSRIFEHFIPDEDARAIQRLRMTGAILVGMGNG